MRQLLPRRLRSRIFVMTAATIVALLGTGSSGAQSGPAFVPASTLLGVAAPAPTPSGVDLDQLLPPTVELFAPVVCGGVTVHDQDDLDTLCNGALALSPPTVPTSCNQVVTGVVRLQSDLVCTDTSGLIVGGDNTIIDLNGHKIVCVGAGYQGSCQGGFDDYGINTAGFDHVHIFSNEPARSDPPNGTIEGFDVGIFMMPDSDTVKVKQITVTGPSGTPGEGRPISVGILSLFSDCDDGGIHIGGGTSTGNDVSNHTRGIEIDDGGCVDVGYNRVHDNKAHDGTGAWGIVTVRQVDSHFRSNVVTNNGDGQPLDGGLILFEFSRGNLVNENQVNGNTNGIGTRIASSGNHIVNNTMFFNTQFDAVSDQTGVNDWNFNNRCATQTTPEPPPGVCGDTPPSP